MESTSYKVACVFLVHVCACLRVWGCMCACAGERVPVRPSALLLRHSLDCLFEERSLGSFVLVSQATWPMSPRDPTSASPVAILGLQACAKVPDFWDLGSGDHKRILPLLCGRLTLYCLSCFPSLQKSKVKIRQGWVFRHSATFWELSSHVCLVTVVDRVGYRLGSFWLTLVRKLLLWYRSPSRPPSLYALIQQTILLYVLLLLRWGMFLKLGEIFRCAKVILVVTGSRLIFLLLDLFLPSPNTLGTKFQII